jgi:hypothetical protein
MKRNTNGQFIQQRWKELAGGQPVTERKEVMSTIVDIKDAANGQTFGILKENATYYIKIKATNGDTARAEDFDYIGGVQNKTKEAYGSLNEAIRRLNAKLFAIHESTAILPEETEEELIDKLDDKSGETEDAPVEEPAMDAPVEEPAMDTPVEAPVMDAPAMGGEAPVEEPAMDAPAAPAMDAPAEEPAMDAPVEEPAMDTPVEAPVMDAPVEDPATEGGEEASGEGDEILAMLGKLGAMITQAPDLSAPLTKNILNTIISQTKDGIEKLDFTEKEELAKRLQKNGQKIEEDAIEGDESIANSTEDMVGGEEGLYEEIGEGIDFNQFCQENGFSTNNDDDVVKAVIAYATKHASQEIDANMESVATEINPYIFNKIEQDVDTDFLEELKSHLSFEQMSLGNGPSALNESHLDKVITKLVFSMIANK